MTQWIVAIAIVVAVLLSLPWQVRSTRRWRKGRTGAAFGAFADGFAQVVDPRRAMIVAEMEKRQALDGEEADGDDEPLARSSNLPQSSGPVADP